MDKEKTAVEQFLGNLEGDKENKNPFNENPEDPFVQEETPAEVTVEEKEEKPLPFQKDPKIQKYLDKREKEIEERIKSSLQTVPTTQGAEDEFKDVMDSLTMAIGNDTPEKVNALNAFKLALNGLDKRASEKAIAHLENISQREAQADREAEEELENAFDNIEENFDVDITSNSPIAKKTRQEFVSFVEKIAPKDQNGDIVDYPDMNSAWETFSEMKKVNPPVNRAKDLASRSMVRSSEAQPSQNQPRMTFDLANDYIDSLK